MTDLEAQYLTRMLDTVESLQEVVLTLEERFARIADQLMQRNELAEAMQDLIIYINRRASEAIQHGKPIDPAWLRLVTDDVLGKFQPS